MLAKGVVNILATDCVQFGADVGVALGSDHGATALGGGVNVIDADLVSKVLESNLVDGVVTSVVDGTNCDVATKLSNSIHGMATCVTKVIKVHLLEIEEANLIDGVVTSVINSLDGNITSKLSNSVHGMATCVAKVVEVHLLEVEEANDVP